MIHIKHPIDVHHPALVLQRRMGGAIAIARLREIGPLLNAVLITQYVADARYPSKVGRAVVSTQYAALYSGASRHGRAVVNTHQALHKTPVNTHHAPVNTHHAPVGQ